MRLALLSFIVLFFSAELSLGASLCQHLHDADANYCGPLNQQQRFQREQCFIEQNLAQCDQWVKKHPELASKKRDCNVLVACPAYLKVADYALACRNGVLNNFKDIAVGLFEFVTSDIKMSPNLAARTDYFRKCTTVECKRTMLGPYVSLFTKEEIEGHPNDKNINPQDPANKNYVEGYSAETLYRKLLAKLKQRLANNTLDTPIIEPWSGNAVKTPKKRSMNEMIDGVLESMGIKNTACYDPAVLAEMRCYALATIIDPFVAAKGAAAIGRLSGLASKSEKLMALRASQVGKTAELETGAAKGSSTAEVGLQQSDLIEPEKFGQFPDGLSPNKFSEVLRGSGTANDAKAATYVSDGVNQVPKAKSVSAWTNTKWKTEPNSLTLLTEKQFKALPDGTVLEDISGKKVIKGSDYIDLDTRGGFIAFGFRENSIADSGKYISEVTTETKVALGDLKKIVTEREALEREILKLRYKKVPEGAEKGTKQEIQGVEKKLKVVAQKESDMREILTLGEPQLKFKSAGQKTNFYEAAKKLRNTNITVEPSKSSAISTNVERNKALGRSPDRIDSNGIPIYSPGPSYFRAMVVKPGGESVAAKILTQDGWKSGAGRGVKVEPEKLGEYGATRLSDSARFEDKVAEFVGPKKNLGPKFENGFPFPRDSSVVGTASSTGVIEVATKTAGELPKGSYIMLTEIAPRNRKIINSKKLFEGRNIDPKFPLVYKDGGVEHAVPDVDPEEIVNVILIPIEK